MDEPSTLDQARPLCLAVLTRAIAPLHPHGGMERAVAEQVSHLRALHVRVRVITQPPVTVYSREVHQSSTLGKFPSELPVVADPLTDELQEPVWPVHWRFERYGRFPLRRNSVVDRLVNYPLFVHDVARQLSVEAGSPPDVWHGHGLLAGAAPAGGPLVYSPHGLEEFSRADWRKWLAYAPMRRSLRHIAQRADAVIATDRAMHAAVVGALRVPASKVVVVPNGVSVARLDELGGAGDMPLGRLSCFDSSLRLVTVARLEANKGLSVMVEALARAQHRLPRDWCWVVVGTGREELRLRAMIQQAGLAGHIQLLGTLDDDELHAILPHMDIFVLPSLYEGSSIATLEAMAHRLPVVATPVGGLPDKVVPHETGWLVAPGDATALASVLGNAVAMRPTWRAMGERGRRLVLDHFDWPHLARLYLELYGRLRTARSSA